MRLSGSPQGSSSAMVSSLFTSPRHSTSVCRNTMKIEDCHAIDPSQSGASKITGMHPCYYAVWPRNKKRRYREWQRKEMGRKSSSQSGMSQFIHF